MAEYKRIDDTHLSAIPEGLTSVSRWVVWFDKKLPTSPRATNKSGEMVVCDITNSDNWVSFSEAVSALGRVCHGPNRITGQAVGVGFVVGDGYYCIDVDGGQDHGRETPSAEVVNELINVGTYVELSVSGCGYHAFGRTDSDIKSKSFAESKTSVEFEYFAHRKFIAVTGNRISGMDDITDDDQTAFVHAHILDPLSKREQAERAKYNDQVRRNITPDMDEKQRFFMLNYIDILRNTDSGNYKRNQWVGLVKAMRDVGVPYPDVLDWCQRGHNFKDEKDVLHVWNERKTASGRPMSVAVLVSEAQQNGVILQRTESYTFNHADDFADGYAEAEDTNTELVTGETVHTVKAEDTHHPDQAEWGEIETEVKHPEFPIDCLPQWCVDLIRAYVAYSGCPIEYCIASLLGTVSASVVGHAVVQVNQGYRERVQLYQVFTGISGTMKSPAINFFMHGLKDLLFQSNENAKKENTHLDLTIKDLQNRVDQEKRKKSPDITYINERVAEIEAEREKKHALYPVPLDDVTPEALLQRMVLTNGVANIASGEGNIINVLTGHSYAKQGQGANVDTFLKAFDGDSVSSARVTSGDNETRSVNLSLLLALQPVLLERLCSSEDDFSRGMVQRFLIYDTPTRVNDIDYTKLVPVKEELTQKWYSFIVGIFKRFMHPDNTIPITMTVAPEVEYIINQYRNRMRDMINEYGTASDTLSGYFGKGHGRVVRLSAILALLNDENASTISVEDVRNAIRMMDEYYIPTMMNIYLSSDTLTKPQHAVVDYLIREYRKGNTKVSVADMWRKLRLWACFKGDQGKGLFETTKTELVKKNYIRVQSVNQDVGNGRKYRATLVELNPKVIQ